jgi:7-carboxy-7-deazaguanine synthase
VLKITEIYRSIQGESTWSGLPCTFVRLTGCNLRCSWCDTEYGFFGGKKMSIDDVFQEIEKLNCPLVELTGGEPLLQPKVALLADRLLDAGYQVLVETGGHMDIDIVSSRAVRIVDMKCPASEMTDKNDYKNLERVTNQDEIKFVIQNKEDFIWAEALIKQYKLESKCTVILSPVFGVMAPLELTDLLLESGLNVRMQMQLHKLLWSPDKTGV